MEMSGRYLLCYLSPTPPYSFLIPQGAWLPGDLCLPCSLATHIFVLGISDLSLLITTFMPVLCGHLSSSGFLGHIHAAQQKAGMGLGLRGCQPFSTWSQGTVSLLSQYLYCLVEKLSARLVPGGAWIPVLVWMVPPEPVLCPFLRADYGATSCLPCLGKGGRRQRTLNGVTFKIRC